MNENKNVLLHKVARKIFEEATAASLGGTFNVIISFHLKQKFGKDPYEVLIDNPRTFNDGLKEVLGEGAEAVMFLAAVRLTTDAMLSFIGSSLSRVSMVSLSSFDNSNSRLQSFSTACLPSDRISYFVYKNHSRL
jgi:hypothetical protein